jgi:ribosomal-protein-alanine N-acetyltransferase
MPPTVTLVPLGPDVLRALIARDLDGARRAAGIALPAGFAGDDDWLWRMRLGQIEQDPGCERWLLRAVVDEATGAVVGYAGFHDAPDERGMVEFGYEIDAEHRRRGYATAALRVLIAYAQAHGAQVIRASIAPDNAGSLAIARRFGFAHVGEQWDERDGRELLFERALGGRCPPADMD